MNNFIATTILTREIAVLALTLPWVVMGFYLIWQIQKMRRWQGETMAKILSFKMEGGILDKRAAIHYSYLANGVLLEGARITICDSLLASGYIPVQKLARLFPPGKEVTVYFDENRPQKCVLKKSGYLLPAVICACGLIAAISLVCWVGGGNTLPPKMRPTIFHF